MKKLKDVEGAFRLASELLREGRNKESERLLREIVGTRPVHAGAWHCLGRIAHQSGRLPEARDALTRAGKLDALQPVYPYTLGLVLHDLRDLRAAADSYREAIRRHPGFAEAWNNLGLVLQDLNAHDEAERAWLKALELRNDYVAARRNLAALYRLLGDASVSRNRLAEAAVRYRQALSLTPDALQAKFELELMLPVVYASAQEISAARSAYSAGIQQLEEMLPSLLMHDCDEVLSALRRSNFYLAYQGENDLSLQSRYGDFVHALLSHHAPGLMRSIPLSRIAGRRIRIGFVSRFTYRCTVGLYFQSWMTQLDRDRFEVFVFSLGSREDDVTKEIKSAVDHFSTMNGRIEVMAEAVRDAQVDVLVFPELGMDADTFLLAAFRLAPVQCAAWGHPVTSGLPNVDVYLSVDCMEPAGAERYYRERLMLLPGIGTRYPVPVLPAWKSRADMGLPESKTLYLFPQSPFKIHPDNDFILAGVLAGDEDGVLVMFEGQGAEVSGDMHARLIAAGISADRIVVLPVMSHDDYLRINMLCDLMLDSYYWSGGNTSLDALACGLPIVTLPGAFMRGRQSAGMLRLMGVSELVAESPQEYLAIASRLGTDPQWRSEIRSRIVHGLNAVFDCSDAVDALQHFFSATCSPA